MQKQIYQELRNNELHKKEAEARKPFEFCNKAKMSFLKRNVKSEWIKGGDENTSYFHACLRKRRIQNHISRIKNVNGVWMDSPAKIEEVVVDYYVKLFGIEECRKAKVTKTIVDEGHVISTDQQNGLC